jgi:hypothetical protein
MGRRGVLVLLTVLLLLPATYLVATSSALRQSIPLLALAGPGIKSETIVKSESAEVPLTPSSTTASASTPPAPAAEEASAATIVADAPAAIPEPTDAAAVPNAQPGPVQVATVMAPQVEQPLEASKQATAAVAAATPVKSARRKEAKEPASPSTARSKRPEARHTAVAKAHAPAIVAKESKGKDSKDKDVDLIAALLNHISSRPGPASKDFTQKSAGTSSSSLSQADALGRQGKRAPSRDIVVQTAGETKESLISRCRSLGFLEGELCRIRICSGSWGTDPACSMESGVRGE